MQSENLIKNSFPPKELKKVIQGEIERGLDDYEAEKGGGEKVLTEDVENNYERRKEEDLEVPEGLIEIRKFIQESGYDDLPSYIYEWYSGAMTRRENRHPLEEDRFIYHFFECGSHDQTYMYGDLERGFLLGYVKNGVFIISHFAPISLRSGYDLIKDLGENNKIPAIMGITEDLATTLRKMPTWKITDLGFVSRFHGEAVKKNVAYNSYPGIEKKLKELLSHFESQSISSIS